MTNRPDSFYARINGAIEKNRANRAEATADAVEKARENYRAILSVAATTDKTGAGSDGAKQEELAFVLKKAEVARLILDDTVLDYEAKQTNCRARINIALTAAILVAAGVQAWTGCLYYSLQDRIDHRSQAVAPSHSLNEESHGR